MAVRFVILFLECSLVKLFKAESTDEMFGVEFLVHSGYTASCDRFLTTGAQRSSLKVVVGLAVWLTFMIKETTTSKVCVTFL